MPGAQIRMSALPVALTTKPRQFDIISAFTSSSLLLLEYRLTMPRLLTSVCGEVRSAGTVINGIPTTASTPSVEKRLPMMSITTIPTSICGLKSMNANAMPASE